MQGGPRASPTATKGRYGDNSTPVAVNLRCRRGSTAAAAAVNSMTKLPPPNTGLRRSTTPTQRTSSILNFGCENKTDFRFGIFSFGPFLKFFFLQDFLACFQLSSPTLLTIHACTAMQSFQFFRFSCSSVNGAPVPCALLFNRSCQYYDWLPGPV